MPTRSREQALVQIVDAHAIENQALSRCSRGPEDRRGRRARRALRGPSRRDAGARATAVRATRGSRLAAVGQAGRRPSRQRLRAGGFFGAQPDTPAKLAGFAFAFEHIEFASYELLQRIAERAGDTAPAEVARSILREERAMAARLRAHFDTTVDATLADTVSEEAGA